MQCHSLIWKDSPKLAPVRESFKSGKSLNWTRVHDLPDYAYFNHGIHLQKGIGCVTCHGRVDKMPLTWREQTLHMKWCLDCHRNPENYVRPRDQVFSMTWTPEEMGTTQEELGPKLVKEYQIQTVPLDENGERIADFHGNQLTNCSVCHR
jgi:hypothetical protein